MQLLFLLFAFLTSCSWCSSFFSIEGPVEECIPEPYHERPYYGEVECAKGLDICGFAECKASFPSRIWEEGIDIDSFSEVIIPYALELKKTKRLRFEDSKVYYGDFVDRFRVIFSTQHILELCDARELLVDVVEGLLNRMNESPEVVASFDHSPITADDLEIYFSFESSFVEYLDPSYIVWMSLHDGYVYIYDGTLKDYYRDFWDARIEPYYKSLLFVNIARQAEKAYDKAHPPKKALDATLSSLSK